MSVTFEILEKFIGTRTQESSDPENESETITTVEEVRDVQVKFTCKDTACIHERSVNVCYDEDGAYDEEATTVRIQEVANGVANKMALGVISNKE